MILPHPEWKLGHFDIAGYYMLTFSLISCESYGDRWRSNMILTTQSLDPVDFRKKKVHCDEDRVNIITAAAASFTAGKFHAKSSGSNGSPKAFVAWLLSTIIFASAWPWKVKDMKLRVLPRLPCWTTLMISVHKGLMVKYGFYTSPVLNLQSPAQWEMYIASIIMASWHRSSEYIFIE